MSCKRCGQCCLGAYIALYSIKVDDDKQEFGRWLNYHSVRIGQMPTDEGDVLLVKISTTCHHLKFNKKTKEAFCAIYETRPQICREHYCDIAKED